jgi:hypothetical protein
MRRFLLLPFVQFIRPSFKMPFTDFFVVTILDVFALHIPNDVTDDKPCIIQVDDTIDIVISSQ